MRNEADGVVDSLDETFLIGRELAIPVVVSHHKVLGTPNYGRSAETLPIIEQAMRSQEAASTAIPTAPPRPSFPGAASASPRRCWSRGPKRIPSSRGWT